MTPTYLEPLLILAVGALLGFAWATWLDKRRWDKFVARHRKVR